MGRIKGFICPVCGWQNYQLIYSNTKSIECVGCSEPLEVKNVS